MATSTKKVFGPLPLVQGGSSLNDGSVDVVDLQFPSEKSTEPTETITVNVLWSAGVTAGELTVEIADDPAFAGTWAEVIKLPFKADQPDIVQFSAGVRAVRTRVSIALTGGTVSANVKAV